MADSVIGIVEDQPDWQGDGAVSLEADDDPASTCKNQCAKPAPAARQFASPCRYTHR
jgi:hypothetical protein